MKELSDQNNTNRSKSNANLDFYSESSNNSFNSSQASFQAPQIYGANTVVQRQAVGGAASTSISLAEAKRQILNATKGLGTDEEGIYNAIRSCDRHRSLMYDAEVINALNNDMNGHDLWKSYLLIEYGNETNFPSAINQLWEATKGFGTDEDAVFAALESMDTRTKSSFGLSYILHRELSGGDLQKALDLITVSDSINGNIYGSQQEGVEDLVVNEENLRELIDSSFVGAASEGLQSSMEILYQKPGGTVLTETLARIESIRGLAPGSALAQYNLAMSKQTSGIERYKTHMEEEGNVYIHAKHNPSPPLDLSEHKDFTASNAQLRFGKIVGDVFGIDAVFGSLISPTGGMAGGGNERVPIVKDGGAVATHGAIHDAAGYLYNCHGIGPGYDYLESEPGSIPGHHLAGQTNMQWFIDEFDRTGNDVQWFERFLNSKTNIGASFSKDFNELNIEQKKDALKVIAGTSSFMLGFGDISNTDRKNKVIELFDSCSAEEKLILADYFYNNNGFNARNEVFSIIRPYVSEDVYNDYILRQSIQSRRF